MSIDAAKIEDIAWAAGLFEGEGYIGFYNPSGPNRSSHARMSLMMTDEDVVREFYSVVGVGRVRGPEAPRGTHKKPRWWWTVQGHENVQMIVAAFWRWLGCRRRAKATEVLKHAATQAPPSKYRKKKIGDVCLNGHVIDRNNSYIYPNGKVTCRQCRKDYSASYYRASKGVQESVAWQ